jgi:serine/threonine protein kinase
METLIGRRFGGYRVTRYIARGGMGVVFEGVQESLDRPVAIKILYPHLSSDPNLRDRFDREARAVVRLNHPNIVRILDYGHDGEYHYMVMDYIDGESLRDRLERARREGVTLRPAIALEIIREVGNALAHAHALGFVHRDVKPGNILLTRDERAVLTDFGVVKILGNTHATSTGTMVGTPEYMAPEQGGIGGEVGPAADQYALAIVAYEMLLGRVPFSAQTPVAVLHLQASAPPTPPGLIIPWFPPEAEAALLRALSKKPADRFETVAQFVEELTAAADPMRDRSRTTIPPIAPLVPPPSPPAGQSTMLVAGEPPRTSGGTNPSFGGHMPAPPAPPYPPPAGDDESGGRPLWIATALAVLLILAVGTYLLVFSGGGGDDDDDNGAGASAVTKTPTPEPDATAENETATATAAAPAATNTPTTGATSTIPIVVPQATDTAESVATVTVEPTATSGVPAGFREVIVFSSHRGGIHDSQVYIMNPDGSEQTQLVASRGHSWGPRLSPDGTLLMFSSVAPGEHSSHDATGGGTTGSGNHEIYLGASDGTGLTKLTEQTSWDNGWTFTPDGTRIAFTSDRNDGNWEIYTMALDGSDVQRLTNDPGEDGWPSWTPDGEQVVFASNRTGNWEIHIMNADGSDVRQLTSIPEKYDTYPFVSPDGQWVVFSSQVEASREGEIYLMRIDGTDLTRLTNTVALNYAPSWSPDGSKIVFVSDRDGNENIFTMNPDGSDQQRLTDDPGEDTTPAWGFVPAR